MLDWSTVALFAAAATALIIVPGPAVLYIVARSIEQGRTAGIVSVLGIGLGALIHVTAAALGLSAILASSSMAFSVVKYGGAAYLIFLGLRTLFTREKIVTPLAVEQQQLARAFWQGVFVNVLNPKAALFFFAFLPQFLDPRRGSVILQIFVLGLIFVLIALVSDSTYALLAGSARVWLRNNVHFLPLQRYFAGGVYLALGVATAVSGTGKQK